ncbi:DUF7344 domain-containing protein [Halopiger aswanensis]|uniref:DUF7344 domain-containing protein n=1 Tax=Halopiger aswanensis TaxID=148449 RepID=A0A3R7DCQ5_9EURY|nr:helix-turn-helix transcriptional regulator [Halopiger aswanensis]RKD94894.1 hypothetical protein ATJ93_1737 [Halopiger aswanensis]
MSNVPSESSKNGSDTVDTALEALSHVHRFQLLQSLCEEDPQEAVIASVTDSVERGRDVKSVQIELYHLHLPKLEEAGFIEWEREHDQVSKGPNFDTIEKLLERLSEGRNRELLFN